MANPYMFETVNPMDVALRGFQGIQVLRQNEQQSALLQAQQQAMQAQVRKAEQEMAEAQRFQTDMARLTRQFETGTVTDQDVLRVIAQNPALAEPLKQLRAGKQQAQIDADYKRASDLYTASVVGLPERVNAMLDEAIAAGENEGGPDGLNYAQTMRAIKKLYEQNPKNGEQAFAMMMAAEDEERFAKQFNAIKDYRLAPGQLEKQQGELRQQAAELGLTEAQTQKVMREVAETNARIAAIQAQAEAAKNAGGGFVPPADRFKAEGDLRGEWTKRSAAFVDAYTAFQRLQDSVALGTGAGDTAAIILFRQLLEPGSIVRESEFAQMQGVGGPLDQLRSFQKSLTGKGILSDTARRQLLEAARPYIDGTVKLEQRERANFERMVREYGLNPDNVFRAIAIERPAPTRPAAPPAPAPAPRGDRMQNRAPAQPAERPQILEIRPRGE